MKRAFLLCIGTWLAGHGSAQSFIRVRVRVFLESCFVTQQGLMRDSLRTQQLVPLDEPYAGLGYVHMGDGGLENTLENVLAVTGPDAIVDWVVLELREAQANGFRVATRSALLQRDGDVVEMDGISSVNFDVPEDDYYFSVKHRNHLGVMTATALTFSPNGTPPLDFTLSTTAVWGTNARKDINGTQVLWAGDANGNGQVKYTGSGNDRDPLLLLVGNVTPNSEVLGYYRQDVNMDGRVRYTGSGNDRDRILLAVGGSTPNAVRTAQVP